MMVETTLDDATRAAWDALDQEHWRAALDVILGDEPETEDDAIVALRDQLEDHHIDGANRLPAPWNELALAGVMTCDWRTLAHWIYDAY